MAAGFICSWLDWIDFMKWISFNQPISNNQTANWKQPASHFSYVWINLPIPFQSCFYWFAEIHCAKTFFRQFNQDWNWNGINQTYLYYGLFHATSSLLFVADEVTFTITVIIIISGYKSNAATSISVSIKFH